MHRLAFFFALCLGAVVPVAAHAAPYEVPPTPAPTATPVPPTYVRLIEADVLPGEQTANAVSPNLTGRITNRLRGTLEYKFLGRSFGEIEYRRWDVVHPAGFVTQPLTLTPAFVPQARYVDQDFYVNTSIFGRQHTYLASSTLIHSTNDGDPTVHAQFGFGVERLPDPTKPASIYFSYFYYPEVTGKIAVPAGTPGANLRYKVENFAFGGALALRGTPVFLTAGLVGDHYLRKANAASDATHFSSQLGIGFHR